MKSEEVDAIHRYIDRHTAGGVLQVHANSLKQFILEMCECSHCDIRPYFSGDPLPPRVKEIVDKMDAVKINRANRVPQEITGMGSEPVICRCGDWAGSNGSCGPNGCYNCPA